jgi:hypothetical protein
LDRGAGLPHRQIETGSTPDVSLHPQTYRGAHLHLLRGTEGLQGTGRILELNGIKFSIDKVLRMAKAVTTIQVRLPLNGQLLSRTMVMKRHKPIEKLFDENFWVSQ